MQPQRCPNSDEVILELWPGDGDILESEMEPYAGPLAEFFQSAGAIIDQHQDRWSDCDNEEERAKSPALSRWTDLSTDHGERVARFGPPMLAEILVTVGTGGLATALYAILKSWIELRKGRRIKFKMRDYEIEATEMSPRQFEQFMLKLSELKDIFEDNEKAKQLRASGFEVAKSNAVQNLKAVSALREAVQDRMNRKHAGDASSGAGEGRAPDDASSTCPDPP